MVVYLFHLSAQEADAGGLSLRERRSQTNKLMTSILSLFGVEYDKAPVLKLNHIWTSVFTQASVLARWKKKQCQTLTSKQIPCVTVMKAFPPPWSLDGKILTSQTSWGSHSHKHRGSPLTCSGTHPWFSPWSSWLGVSSWLLESNGWTAPGFPGGSQKVSGIAPLNEVWKTHSPADHSARTWSTVRPPQGLAAHLPLLSD